MMKAELLWSGERFYFPRAASFGVRSAWNSMPKDKFAVKRRFLISGLRPLPKRAFLSFALISFALSTWAGSLGPGSFVTKGPSTAKRIALSFDDGPGPQTEKFLDLLDTYQVKATFFMLSEQVK